MASPALTVRAPATRDEILHELNRLAAEVSGLADSFDADGFFAAQHEGGVRKWSPAEQLRHLTRSTYPLARAFATPRLALALRFGIALRPSESYEALAVRYARYLETERPSSGRFGPSPDAAAPDAARRGEIMTRWRDSVSRLAGAAAGWSERALDRYRLPHPLLGKLTSREMLLFTLFHTSHHARQIDRRRAAGAGRPV